MGSQDDSSLQSIRYQRGSLQLLDQRKLPLDTIYLDIQDAVQGWEAIREMVVRGAPAIAIAAALSLAVEISKLEGFSGTPKDVASFLEKKLECLVSSRPTAINLSDAATKLTEIVMNHAATATDANQVFQWRDVTLTKLRVNETHGMFRSHLLSRHINGANTKTIVSQGVY